MAYFNIGLTGSGGGSSPMHPLDTIDVVIIANSLTDVEQNGEGILFDECVPFEQVVREGVYVIHDYKSNLDALAFILGEEMGVKHRVDYDANTINASLDPFQACRISLQPQVKQILPSGEDLRKYSN